MRRLTPTNCEELLFDDVIWSRGPPGARRVRDLMRDERGEVSGSTSCSQRWWTSDGRDWILDQVTAP